MPKYRIIVSFIEGEFMLIRDFDSMNDGIEYAKRIGFGTYEVTNQYDLEDWEVIDPTLNPQEKLSFAKKNKLTK